MNNIDFLKYSNFPISSETLQFLQSMFLMAAKTASLGGTNYILDGCVESGSNVSSGTVIVNGEILPFEGGAKSDYVVISQNATSVQVYDTSYNDIYVTRKLIFGTGNGQLAWADFKRVPTLLDLDTNKANATDLTSHINNNVSHITAAERTAWNGANAPIGSIVIWPGDVGNIPTNWKLCDGSTLNIADYASVYAVLGNKYGGTTTTFALPNLSGRFVVGYSSSDADYSTVGQTGGEKKHTLTVEEMPSHNHDLYGSDNSDGNNGFPDLGDDTNVSNPYGKTTNAIKSTGGGVSHENRPPYMSLPYIIKVK